MKSIYIGLILMALNPFTVFAKGGDDAGNGGSGLLKRSLFSSTRAYQRPGNIVLRTEVWKSHHTRDNFFTI